MISVDGKLLQTKKKEYQIHLVKIKRLTPKEKEPNIKQTIYMNEMGEREEKKKLEKGNKQKMQNTKIHFKAPFEHD